MTNLVIKKPLSVYLPVAGSESDQLEGYIV